MELRAGEMIVVPTVPQPMFKTKSQMATFCGMSD